MSKFKVTVDISRKVLSSLRRLHLLADFDRTSSKCLVHQYSEFVCNPEFKVQGEAQIFSMTICGTSLRLCIVGPRSR